MSEGERDVAKHADDGPNIPASCHGDCTASLAWLSLGCVCAEGNFDFRLCWPISSLHTLEG